MDDGDDEFEDADLFTEAAALGGDDDYDDVSSVRSSRRGGGRQHNAHRTERLHKDYERREVGGGVVVSSVCAAHVWSIAAPFARVGCSRTRFQDMRRSQLASLTYPSHSHTPTRRMPPTSPNKGDKGAEKDGPPVRGVHIPADSDLQAKVSDSGGRQPRRANVPTQGAHRAATRGKAGTRTKVIGVCY